MRSAKSGVVLAILVVVTAFAAITVFSVTMLVIQSVSRSDAAHKRMKCYYAARAGLTDTAYLCRQQGHWQFGVTLPEKTYIENEVFFSSRQQQADSLVVDTRFVSVEKSRAKRNNIGGIMFYNAVTSVPVKIVRLDLSWASGGRLRKIVIGGKSVWSGRQRSPAYCVIKPVLLSGPAPRSRGFQYVDEGPASLSVQAGREHLSSRNRGVSKRQGENDPGVGSILGKLINSLQFDSDTQGMELSAVFHLSDGSTVERTLYPASDKVLLNLRVEGGIENSPVSRIFLAEYDLISGSLSRAQEVNDAL